MSLGIKAVFLVVFATVVVLAKSHHPRHLQHHHQHHRRHKLKHVLHSLVKNYQTRRHKIPQLQNVTPSHPSHITESRSNIHKSSDIARNDDDLVLTDTGQVVIDKETKQDNVNTGHQNTADFTDDVSDDFSIKDETKVEVPDTSNLVHIDASDLDLEKGKVHVDDSVERGKHFNGNPEQLGSKGSPSMQGSEFDIENRILEEKDSEDVAVSDLPSESEVKDQTTIQGDLQRKLEEMKFKQEEKAREEAERLVENQIKMKQKGVLGPAELAKLLTKESNSSLYANTIEGVLRPAYQNHHKLAPVEKQKVAPEERKESGVKNALNLEQVLGLNNHEEMFAENSEKSLSGKQQLERMKNGLKISVQKTTGDTVTNVDSSKVIPQVSVLQNVDKSPSINEKNEDNPLIDAENSKVIPQTSVLQNVDKSPSINEKNEDNPLTDAENSKVPQVSVLQNVDKNPSIDEKNEDNPLKYAENSKVPQVSSLQSMNKNPSLQSFTISNKVNSSFLNIKQTDSEPIVTIPLEHLKNIDKQMTLKAPVNQTFNLSNTENGPSSRSGAHSLESIILPTASIMSVKTVAGHLGEEPEHIAQHVSTGSIGLTVSVVKPEAARKNQSNEDNLGITAPLLKTPEQTSKQINEDNVPGYGHSAGLGGEVVTGEILTQDLSSKIQPNPTTAAQSIEGSTQMIGGEPDSETADNETAHAPTVSAQAALEEILEGPAETMNNEEETAEHSIQPVNHHLNFCVDKTDGTYVHPDTYDKYIECKQGQTVHKNCPNGSKYNQETKTCDRK